ncbi:oxidoreductase, partial [Vibrio parahaemolyticus]|uniref:oxidoreductase n=1 Tax=Vibrio parahaemolyticus TaxID=670 RepID=UPI004037647B
MVHLGSRALGGIGLVMAEMTAIAPDARVTEGCAGLWNDEQVSAWQRITTFIHQNTSAKIGIQLGHAGRRGSTQR